MADQIFTNATATVPGTVVTAPWLNDVNTAVYDRLTAVGGTLNALTATGPTGMTSYSPGQNFYFTPSLTNGGASTININALGVKNIVKANNIALVASDLIAGQVHEISYDGTSFFLMNPGLLPVASGGTGATTAAQALINLGAVGRLIGVRTFGGSTTYTPTAGTTRIYIKVQGAGGGGGGVNAGAGGSVSVGAGGGSGGYAEGFYTSGFSGAAIVIGAGGIGNGAAAGSAGGGTSFAGLIGIQGGGGGGIALSGAIVGVSGGTGGLVTTVGNVVNINGGTASSAGASFAASIASSGSGSNSILGSGGPGGIAGGGSIAGVSATGYGSGGGGAVQYGAGPGQAGGSGVSGLIQIFEYV